MDGELLVPHTKLHWLCNTYIGGTTTYQQTTNGQTWLGQGPVPWHRRKDDLLTLYTKYIDQINKLSASTSATAWTGREWGLILWYIDLRWGVRTTGVKMRKGPLHNERKKSSPRILYKMHEKIQSRIGNELGAVWVESLRICTGDQGGGPS